jgi:hypothetical protein
LIDSIWEDPCQGNLVGTQKFAKKIKSVVFPIYPMLSYDLKSGWEGMWT